MFAAASARSNWSSASQRRRSTHSSRSSATCAGGPPKPIAPMRVHPLATSASDGSVRGHDARIGAAYAVVRHDFYAVAPVHHPISYFQAVILGLVQGVAEPFPISSLGHGVVLPRLAGWNIHQNDKFFLTFLIATHLATALVLLGFFFKDWVRIAVGLW